MASLKKKAKICKIPENLSSKQVEDLLTFLELTEFQRKKVPLFFSKTNDQITEYRKKMNALMEKVYEENKFTGHYGSNNYINGLPNAVEDAISKQHSLIPLNEEPHLVLQKLAICLEYCTCNFEDPGKVYEVSFHVLGRIDNDAVKILMKEKSQLKVSVLKDIIKYFEPDYFLKHAQDYGIGDEVDFRAYKIMRKLINGEQVDDKDSEVNERVYYRSYATF